ncbi:MAG: hypothetical protein AABX14_00585 [Candidatus Aenigmatarchaeota archaeon]
MTRYARYDKPSKDSRARQQIGYMDSKIAAVVNGYSWVNKHTHTSRLKWTNVRGYLHNRNIRAEQVGLQIRDLQSYERTDKAPCVLVDHTKAMSIY